MSLWTFNNWDKHSSTYLKYCGNLQADHHSHPPLSSSLVAPLKCIYSAIQVTDILVHTVLCKLINSVFQIFPVFILEMPVGLSFCIVQIMLIYFVWIL
jgi:hypothetical protein